MNDPIQCSIDMLGAALEMEEKGGAFYKKASNACQDPQCKEIFLALIEDETIHARRIKQIHTALTTSQCWTREWESIKGARKDLSNLFKDLAKKTKEKLKVEISDLEAIDIAVDFESASISFYQEHRSKASDPPEQAFLDQMILEEKGHWQALKDTRYYLTDPEGWFIEKERAGLDGE
jgi:rubrerythrin